MAKHVWIVCYVDVEEIASIERDLAKKYRRYMDIQAYVPTVTVLEKTFKRHNEYKEVPMLLNYGFFRVPEYFIYNDQMLKILKQDVRAIYRWVMDRAKVDTRKRKGRKIPTIATVSSEAIELLIKTSKKYSIYSTEDVEGLKVGQIITLKTYPFENMMVEIKTIDPKKKECRVKLITDMANLVREVTISFDHIFYTIYHNNNLVNGGREQSIEELRERGFPIDNLYSDGSFEF